MQTYEKPSPELEAELDPKYAQYYNANLVGRPSVASASVEDIRKIFASWPTVYEPTSDVSKRTLEVSVNNHKVPVVLVTPNGTPPTDGWPVLVWYHGGGFIAGNALDVEGDLTYWVTQAQCMVISVDYRLAPEHPFPAAVDDACQAYKWVCDNTITLGINPDKVAVGGCSAGGNLAAVVSHFVAVYNTEHVNGSSVIQPVLQLLTEPMMDCRIPDPEFETENYKKYRNTVPMNAAGLNRMIEDYLPDAINRNDPRASPVLCSRDILPKLPPGKIQAAGCDILRDGAEGYARKLQNAGVAVDFELYKGAPHMLSMCGKYTTDGEAALKSSTQALQTAFKDKEE